jgi:hypothetical protein
MTSQELIWWVLSSVDDGKGERKWMRNVLDRVHQASFSSIDLQDTMAFITG